MYDGPNHQERQRWPHEHYRTDGPDHRERLRWRPQEQRRRRHIEKRVWRPRPQEQRRWRPQVQSMAEDYSMDVRLQTLGHSTFDGGEA